MSDEVIWCNLVRNENKNADNQPDWVAPANPNAPEGKKWTIGVKIGEAWYNPAGWDEKDDQGNLTGKLTIKISPNNASGTPKSTTENKGFQKKPNYDNKQSYKF